MVRMKKYNRTQQCCHDPENDSCMKFNESPDGPRDSDGDSRFATNSNPKRLLAGLVHCLLLLSLISLVEPSGTGTTEKTPLHVSELKNEIQSEMPPTISLDTIVEESINIILESTATSNCDNMESSSQNNESTNDDNWIEEEVEIFVNAQDVTDDNNGDVINNEELFDRDDGILIVATVDGTLAGISKTTGQMVWKRSPKHSGSATEEKARGSTFMPSTHTSGSKPTETDSSEQSSATASNLTFSLDPLVYTTTTAETSRSDKWRTIAVPSILDGKVYLTAADVSVTTTAKELVARAPFADRRGRIYTGSTVSTAVAIDANTGEIIQVSGSKNNFTPSSSSDEEPRRNIVWMGRVDYSVTISEPKSGDIDVHFTTSELMSPTEMVLVNSHERPQSDYEPKFDSGLKQTRHFLPHGDNESPENKVSISALSASDVEEDKHVRSNFKHNMQKHRHPNPIESLTSASVVVTPNGHLAYLDNDTGDIAWVAEENFDTPVAFCMDSTTGRSCNLEIVPDAILPDTSPSYVSSEIKRQLSLFEEVNGRGSTNELQSTNKHVPRMHAHENRRHPHHSDAILDDEPTTIVGSLPGNGQLFAMPLGSSRLRNNFRYQNSQPLMSSVAQSKAKHHRQTLASDLVQRYSQHANFQTHSLHEHDSSHSNTKFPGGSCTPATKWFPDCLVSPSQLNGPYNRIKTSGRYGKWNSYEHNVEVETDGAVVPFFHYPDYSKHFSNEIDGLDPSFYGIQNANHFYNQRLEIHKDKKQHRSFLEMLGPWFPPTVALLFVISFEIGRRKRQWEMDAKKADVDGPVKNTSNTDMSTKSEERIIQVDENVILGYGGHGTVVYKGLLEGREVAVKRMLKTYHASADREISLLIESDGHPNVVRYFLKEVRNDFVYLALELCDLSLHELIGIFRFQNDGKKESLVDNAIQELEPSIPKQTKDILLQIAAGVRHLHHLRIVHRDLKPANILLADTQKSKSKLKRSSTSESVLEVFEKGYLVAKISDMGLGKQLIGQSSYGASLMNSSLRIQSNGGQSSVIGAKGTVGWQAPEVMVHRGNTDVSIKSFDSNRCTFENTESPSPTDAATPSIRTSRSVDIFSLGCIFYTTLLPGYHPFGEWYEREANIMHNKFNIQKLLSLSPEAYDLVGAMINRNPKFRPTAKDVCDHPFFWTYDRKLLFLSDISDRIEIEATPTENGSSLTGAIGLLVERSASEVVGTDWLQALDTDLLNNVQRFRSYDSTSVRDLLRLIRNKYHHFDELPQRLKASMGSNSGLMQYFEKRFPKLLIHCYNIFREALPADDLMTLKYSLRKTQIFPGSTSGNEKTTNSFPRKQLCDPILEPVSSKIEVPLDLECQPYEFSIPQESEIEIEFTPVQNDGAETSLYLDNEVSNCDQPELGDGWVIWCGSETTKAQNCRGWSRADSDWIRGKQGRQDLLLIKCAEDNKFRTRLCNHWDVSFGTACPMRKKNKCDFAHGPVELRVKDGKRTRWGKLVDCNGDCKNPKHSGGEDTYGTARSIECERKEEGKWNTQGVPNNAKKKNIPKSKMKKTTSQSSKESKQ